MNDIPRVLVVEDEPSIAELIAVNLRHSGFEPVIAFEGVAAQREIDAHLPDVVLLDWMLPGQSGESLTRKWRAAERTRNMPIVLLTAKGDEQDKVQGLNAGADDYVTKPFSTQELIARVRAVLRRHAPSAPAELLRVGHISLDVSSHRVSVDGESVKVGPTEFKLLAHFMKHAERVHSRVQLLDQVWGDDTAIEERTVDVHVKRLREALGEWGVAVETVRGAGYRLTAQATLSKKT
ncbi:MAG: phosphate regulon transcriptional regulator PhoB [Burkholderiaceae bacterium]|jgi:two-component system phosphate regulon response regulator PhoB|tara:strand:- start:192 stop:899 length:708 start_codon:yes stop_codon:yes gene_type:complete